MNATTGPIEYLFTFNAVDYGVLIFILSLSAAIGVYFGYYGKAKTTDEYLLGGKRMKTIPIAISLVASQLSAMSVMAIPAEMYSHGIELGLMVPAMMAVILILSFVVIPVFYENNLSNCYQYLELRFNKQTRQVVTVAFLLTVYLTIPVFIFIPSLAFSQVTSVNIHLINAIVCSVCVFYTMMGGIKAVVWTDVVQAAIMLGSCILIAGLGIYEVGGVTEVFTRAYHGGRLDINMNINLVDRTSFWNCFFGSVVIWTGYVGLNQSCVQRIVALPTLADAKRSLAIFCVGFFLIMSLNCLTGIIMFARYFSCDPVKLKIVDKADKLMPFFVQDIVGHLKGMPGIFISCVFSAALSTISANLNSISGIIYFDYIKPFVKHTEPRANLYMKAVVVITGIYSVLGGFVVEKFTSILQIVITICGITQGAVVGVFTLGMLYPKANGKSAFISTLLSMVIMGWIIIGSQILISRGELKYDPLPTRIDECSQFNFTTGTNLTDNAETLSELEEKQFSIYKTSFNWFIIFGAALVWITGIPLSHILKDDEKKFNISLISPIAKCLVPKKLKHSELSQQDDFKVPECSK